jgi:crossover junction endodeoxyribonuclease RuvC
VVVLGIDPGTQKMGFGVVEKRGSRYIPLDGGVIKFQSRDLQTAIKEFPEEFDSLFNKYRVDEVAVETIFFANNPQSIIKLSQFRGAILFYLLQKVEKVWEYSPLEIKESVTGNGKSTKEQVNFMVKKLLGISGEIKPLDVSDALGVAITHHQRRVFSEIE